jgi:hypothetical protein
VDNVFIDGVFVVSSDDKHKLKEKLEFIENWNPEKQVVFELADAFTKIEGIASKWKDHSLREPLENYRRLYKGNTYYDIEKIDARLSSKVVINNNRVIATDHEGNCMLELGIDEFGNTLKFLYETYPLEYVWQICKKVR